MGRWVYIYVCIYMFGYTCTLYIYISNLNNTCVRSRLQFEYFSSLASLNLQQVTPQISQDNIQHLFMDLFELLAVRLEYGGKYTLSYIYIYITNACFFHSRIHHTRSLIFIFIYYIYRASCNIWLISRYFGNKFPFH